MSRVFKSPTGWCCERLLIFYQTSKISPGKHKSWQYTALRDPSVSCTVIQIMESKANAKDFTAVMKLKLEGRNLDNVLNIDQMPIPFLYYPNMMLEVKGQRSADGTLQGFDH
jgi:hypothetical protein